MISRLGRMGSPTDLDLVQNSALGAFLVWRYGLAFQETKSELSPLQFAFLILPVTFHAETLEFAHSTQKASGLSMFAAKLGARRDDLIAIHERTLRMRALSLESIGVAAAQRLISIKYENGYFRSNATKEDIRLPNLQGRLKKMTSVADKLGAWFSKEKPQQVATSLLVEF